VQIYQVFGTSVTLNWAGLGAGNAEGISAAGLDRIGLQRRTVSSSTPDVNEEYVTLTGLSGSTTYYLRVGGLNWNTAAS